MTSEARARAKAARQGVGEGSATRRHGSGDGPKTEMTRSQARRMTGAHGPGGVESSGLGKPDRRSTSETRALTGTDLWVGWFDSIVILLSIVVAMRGLPAPGDREL